MEKSLKWTKCKVCKFINTFLFFLLFDFTSTKNLCAAFLFLSKEKLLNRKISHVTLKLLFSCLRVYVTNFDAKRFYLVVFLPFFRFSCPYWLKKMIKFDFLTYNSFVWPINVSILNVHNVTYERSVSIHIRREREREMYQKC